MAQKCINTRDLIKSNEHEVCPMCYKFKKKTKQKAFVLEKGSLGETPMTGFHTLHLHV